MKKILTSIGLLLLPFLISSYELDLEYEDLTKQLQSDLVTNIQQQQFDLPDDYYAEKIENVVESSIGLFEDKIIFQRYYRTGHLKTYLQKYNLANLLKNNEQVQHQVARYIVNHYPHNNDFEALLAIGVDPVEAAVRLNNEEYIKSALETGTITYPHCYVVTTIDMDASRSYSKGYTEPATIEVNTSKEQIEEIKLKIQKQEQIRKHSHPLRKLWNKVNSLPYFHG